MDRQALTGLEEVSGGADRNAPTAALLEPGRNCWRRERAERLATIVDAADYFSAAKAAMMKAQHSMLLIGWKFDLRMNLEPQSPKGDPPDDLGGFLKWMATERPSLRIYVLQWDGAMLATIGRQILPMLWLELLWRRRISFRLDSDHPFAACHHQKIVVIDDALAFCGGIDMTADRWDTRGHLDDNPSRVRPDGSPFPPFHDVAVAVDGPAARALGDLARLRWYCATGRRLAPPPPLGSIWPERLQPSLENVDIAIARTLPARPGRAEVREIERLYLDAIGAARRLIYCESQYLASASIADALVKRLAEADGPEVIIVNPKAADTWLEAQAMDTARAVLLERLRAADRYGRFKIYFPVTAEGVPIYVHAKVLIIDDRLLRIGSSNLNNRSLGFDTESDLALEAPGQGTAETAVRRQIVAFCHDLLAEHLDVEPATVQAAAAETGSMIAAVERLRRSQGRTLRPLNPDPPDEAERLIVSSRLLDPEHAGQTERRLTYLAKRMILAPGQVLRNAGRVVAALLTSSRQPA